MRSMSNSTVIILFMQTRVDIKQYYSGPKIARLFNLAKHIQLMNSLKVLLQLCLITLHYFHAKFCKI
jgi:hypothetical protein